HLSAVEHVPVERQTVSRHLLSRDEATTDDPDLRMLFRTSDHALYAVGIDPIVRLDDLAVATFPGDIADCPIVVRNLINELAVRDDPDPRIHRGISPGDREGPVGAAVIGEDVLEVAVRLS